MAANISVDSTVATEDPCIGGGKVKNKEGTPERVVAKPLPSEFYTQSSCQYEFKVLLVGSLVGCSCFYDRFYFGKFDEERTIDTDEIYTKPYQLNDDVVSTTLCDLGVTQEGFEAIRLAHLRSADAVIILYDITRYDTFTDAGEHYKEIQRVRGYPAEFTCMLMGTKCDLEDQRKVPQAEAMEFAKTHNMMFIETSAKESINVEKAIIDLTTELYLKKKPLMIKAGNKKSKCQIS